MKRIVATIELSVGFMDDDATLSDLEDRIKETMKDSDPEYFISSISIFKPSTGSSII